MEEEKQPRSTREIEEVVLSLIKERGDVRKDALFNFAASLCYLKYQTVMTSGDYCFTIKSLEDTGTVIYDKHTESYRLS